MDHKKLIEFALYGGLTIAVIAALYWLHNKLYPAQPNLPNAGPTLADYGISDPQGLGGALTTPYGENVAGMNGQTNPGGNNPGGGGVAGPPGGNPGGNQDNYLPGGNQGAALHLKTQQV